MKILYQMKDGLSRGGKLFSLFRGKFQKALDTGSGLCYNKKAAYGAVRNFVSALSSVRIEYRIPIPLVVGSNPPGRARPPEFSGGSMEA